MNLRFPRTRPRRGLPADCLGGPGLNLEGLAAVNFISPVRPGSGRGQTLRSRSRQEPKALRPGKRTPDLRLWSACTPLSWQSLRRPSSGRRTLSRENACPCPFKPRPVTLFVVHGPFTDPHNHLIKMPSVTRARAPSPQPLRHPRSELQHPAADRLIETSSPRSARSSSTSR